MIIACTLNYNGRIFCSIPSASNIYPSGVMTCTTTKVGQSPRLWGILTKLDAASRIKENVFSVLCFKVEKYIHTMHVLSTMVIFYFMFMYFQLSACFNMLSLFTLPHFSEVVIYIYSFFTVLYPFLTLFIPWISLYNKILNLWQFVYCTKQYLVYLDYRRKHIYLSYR